MKQKVIVIVGPTAVGKTKLGIAIAKLFNGEIISGDSMQIYKGLDIGTAKVTEEESDGIVHHLINEKYPEESYTVSEFQSSSKTKIKDISNLGKLPIIVGGAGLYIESLLFDVSHAGESDPDPSFRKAMEKIAEKEGKESLWNKLDEVDPSAAEKIHSNNLRRVIRALEVYKVTGKTFSMYQEERTQRESIYDACIIGLNTNRNLLYDRINQRVELMIEQGLLEEAKQLWETVRSDAQSAKGIGYKELFPFFENKMDLDHAVDQIKQNSRRYAKRQLTWFKNRFEMDKWFDIIEYPQQEEQCINYITEFLRK